MTVDINRFRELSRKAQILLVAAMLTATSLVPVILQGTVLAAPTITERELQASSGVPGATGVTLTWIFDTTADVADIDHIEIEFCDAPLTTCAAPTNIPTLPASPTATLTNFTSGGNSASNVGGDDGGTLNQILIDKTTVDAGANLDEATISIGGFTNDSVANTSYYTRMRIYSDTGATLAWEGIFAQSTSQTLTVSARVQERLDFCVGSTAVNNATNVPASVPATCAAISGSTVNLGNIESSTVNVSPVATVNGGDATPTNGLAMIRTNAVNGAVVEYKAMLNNSSGSLKVPGSTCSGTASTDQCFNSAGTSSVTLTNGAELFGMVVAGINCSSVSAYVCDFSAGTYNLVRDAAYDGAAAPNNIFVADTNQVTGTTAGEYAWDDSGGPTLDRIASSAASTVKVIDDEAMILKFAATSAITTPTGSYSVQADFVATTTF